MNSAELPCQGQTSGCERGCHGTLLLSTRPLFPSRWSWSWRTSTSWLRRRSVACASRRRGQVRDEVSLVWWWRLLVTRRNPEVWREREQSCRPETIFTWRHLAGREVLMHLTMECPTRMMERGGLDVCAYSDRICSTHTRANPTKHEYTAVNTSWQQATFVQFLMHFYTCLFPQSSSVQPWQLLKCKNKNEKQLTELTGDFWASSW